MAELLETLGEAITIRDPHDRLVYANRAALAHLGFDTLDELKARSLDSIMNDYIVTDEHGDPLHMSDVPSVRLLRGQTSEPLLMRTVDRRTGEVRWDLLKAAGLAGRDGKPTAAVTVIEDLTAVKTAEIHLRILSEAGRVLTSMLGLEQMLQSVAELAIPEFADWSAVDLIAEDLARDHVAIAHADPARRALVAQMSEFRAPRLSPDSMLGRVFVTGRSVLLEQVGDELLQQRARDETDLEFMRALRIRSAIIAPLRVRARTIGVMTFCTAESQRRLTQEDLALAEQLADRVAIARSRARVCS